MAESLAFEARIFVGSKPTEAAKSIIDYMENDQLRACVDEMFERSDKKVFEIMSKMVDRVRGIGSLAVQAPDTVGKNPSISDNAGTNKQEYQQNS